MSAAARILSKAAPARAAASRAAVATAPKRGMAGGGPPPQYTGIEAQVRAFLPKDEHLVVGIMGFYVGVYFVGKGVMWAFSSPKKAAPAPETTESAAPVPPPLPGSGDGSSIPTGDDYWQWLDAPGNLEKVLATMEK